MTKSLVLLLVVLFVTGSVPSRTGNDLGDEDRPADPARFDGTWAIQENRSSAIDPWKDLTLKISATESEVTLKRIWKGDYGFSAVDSIAIPIDGTPRPVAVQQWPDNRHIGVFVGPDGEKSVSATWLDGGRTLRITTRMSASVSQGKARIRIHSEYRLSPTGDELVLLELRSTRPRPRRYTFERTRASGS